MEEKERKMLEFLKKVSPGMPLRNVIDDIIRSDMGALIVFDSPKITECIEGGFRVNCRFTPQRLFELCKMDGAVVISQDMKRIFYGNVLLTPSTSVSSNETGTRHKAADKTSKQAETFVIAVSERRKKTTIYFNGLKYSLRNLEDLLRVLSNNLQIIEKQREQFDELISKLNILELSGLVTVSDVCRLLQKSESILKIAQIMRKDLIEAGKEGNIISLRFRELTKNVEKIEEDILRDYSEKPLKRSKKILDSLTLEGLSDISSIARVIFDFDLTKNISPKGIRFLEKVGLGKKDISLLLSKFNSLDQIINSDQTLLEEILKGRASQIKENIYKLREEILEGKVVI
ncbi:MAG: DNA integrity scanning diadenylate cyclase DisA [Candidatus Pacearchaeota archaeon]